MCNRIIVLLVSVLFIGCSEKEFDEASDLKDLRVLALVASVQGDTTRSEAAVGETVVVTPYISDLYGSGGLKATVRVCADPGIAYGADPTCVGSPTETTLASSATLTLPSAANNYTGAADTYSFTIPSTLLTGRSAQDQYNGVTYLFEYVLSNAAGSEVRSIKRILVSGKSTTEMNKNPVLSDIFSNGQSLTSMPFGQTVSLTPSFASASAESYLLKLTDGSLRTLSETLTTSWFISDGDLVYLRTLSEEANSYEAPGSAPSGRKAFVIAVTLDGRGGSAVVVKSF